MRATPITQRAAYAWIKEHHRHHSPPRGDLFRIAAEDDTGNLVGIIVIGRPVSRRLQDGRTAEVTRLCTTGEKNVCSFLLARAWRAARALGYDRIYTYTLPHEGGGSLRAAGWTLDGEAGGGSWSREQRIREDKHPVDVKHRWVKRRA